MRQYEKMVRVHLRTGKTPSELFDYYCEQLRAANSGDLVSLNKETGAVIQGDPRFAAMYEGLLEALVDYV